MIDAAIRASAGRLVGGAPPRRIQARGGALDAPQVHLDLVVVSYETAQKRVGGFAEFRILL